MSEKRWKFSIIEDGLEVAGGEGTRPDCEREAMHYFAIYSQYGGQITMNVQRVGYKPAPPEAS